MVKKLRDWEKREIEKCEWIAKHVVEKSESARGVKAYYDSLVK